MLIDLEIRYISFSVMNECVRNELLSEQWRELCKGALPRRQVSIAPGHLIMRSSVNQRSNMTFLTPFPLPFDRSFVRSLVRDGSWRRDIFHLIGRDGRAVNVKAKIHDGASQPASQSTWQIALQSIREVRMWSAIGSSVSVSNSIWISAWFEIENTMPRHPGFPRRHRTFIDFTRIDIKIWISKKRSICFLNNFKAQSSRVTRIWFKHIKLTNKVGWYFSTTKISHSRRKVFASSKSPDIFICIEMSTNEYLL